MSLTCQGLQENSFLWNSEEKIGIKNKGAWKKQQYSFIQFYKKGGKRAWFQQIC
jgi:hypothetical protein